MANADDGPRVDDVDGLYRLRPEDFVSARDSLARRLRDEGRKDEAAAVKKRRRPTVVAWAVDQLAEVAPADLDRLAAESERLREAQHEALGGNAGDLRQATESRRRTVEALAAFAADRLIESGVSDSRHEQEIAATIDAASLDPDAAEDLRAGRLERELERSGFAFPSDWAPGSGPARDEQAEEEARREHEAQRERAERDLRRARDRLDAAEEEVERLSRRLARANEEKAAATEAVREAESRLQEVDREA